MIVVRLMPDVKKHSDNTMVMVQPIIRALNLEFGYCISQNIVYIWPFDWMQPPGRSNLTKQTYVVLYPAQQKSNESILENHIPP